MAITYQEPQEEDKKRNEDQEEDKKRNKKVVSWRCAMMGQLAGKAASES
jgi:hypothetical protein